MVDKRELVIKIFTDGACSGNPGAGGWGALLLIKSDKSKEKAAIRGGEKFTTNNRMELLAVIEALQFVHKNMKNFKCNVVICTDSSYIVDSIVEKRLNGWAKNGWLTKRDTPIMNKDLWERMIVLLDLVKPTFEKVKGHSGNKFNDYVDAMAVAERDKYKQLLEVL